MAWRGTRRATRWMKLKSDISVDIGGEDAEICLVLFCMFMWGLTCFVGVLPVCLEGECACIELCYYCNCNYIWKFMEMVVLSYTLFLNLSILISRIPECLTFVRSGMWLLSSSSGILE